MTTGRIAARKQDSGASIDSNIDMDEFYSIPGLQNYLLSKDGLVYSKRHKKIMKTDVSKAGYHRLILFEGSKKYRFLVHRLVALTFIPNTTGAKEVNHIDGNKANNSVKNLEWCTTRFNHKHAEINGLKAKGDTHGMTKISKAEVDEIKAKYKPRKYSASMLGAEYGVTKNAIFYILKNR